MDYRGEKNPKNLKITIAKIQQLLKLNFLANDEKKGISSAHQEAAPKKKKKGNKIGQKSYHKQITQ